MAPITIPPLSQELPPLRGTGAPAGLRGEAAPSFADALGQAVSQVDALHVAADRDASRVALGGGNLHETALALEKADLALRVAVKVRNKLVEAYQDIMRMNV
jgi:flagellar hook-basal body complex protein FliE